MRDAIDPHFDYAEAMSGPLPDYLIAVERQTYLKMVSPQMLSGRLQGRVLSMLSKLAGPRDAVEIGTFTGYSALCLAEGLAPGGRLYTIEGNAETAWWARRHIADSPLADRIDLRVGEAQSVLPTLPPQMWDLVFLDGDKRGYPTYFDYFADRLRSGGLLLADNVLWDGRTGRPQQDPAATALRQYSDLLLADDRFEVVVLPLRDGLSVARRR